MGWIGMKGTTVCIYVCICVQVDLSKEGRKDMIEIKRGKTALAMRGSTKLYVDNLISSFSMDSRGGVSYAFWYL
jgi:hypothetical protein